MLYYLPDLAVFLDFANCRSYAARALDTGFLGACGPPSSRAATLLLIFFCGFAETFCDSTFEAG